MGRVKQLEATELYRRCDPEQFTFKTTQDLEDLTEVLGQSRAVEAMQFGVGIDQEGYNIFALGPTGMGKQALVRQYFEQRASTVPPPFDWCYVNNFDDSRKPRAIHLPAGRGVEFHRDMEQVVQELSTALSTAFESEEYQTRRQSIMEESGERQSQAFKELQEHAQKRDVALIRTPVGLAVAPVRKGQVLSPEEIQKMPQKDQERLQAELEAVQEELGKILRQVPGWQREMREKMKGLDHQVAEFAVGGLLEELREKYAEFSQIVEHLNNVQKDIVDNAGDFLRSEESQPDFLALMQQAGLGRSSGGPPSLRRYQVNVLVDHSESKGAPVIYEDNPSYENLIGRVEHMAQLGALLTDFNLIKPGALHKANGGYLILDARKLLLQPFAWEGLKRALQSQKIRIESAGEMLSLISTVSLEPEPIPLNLKVALVGERLLYYMMWQLDPDFAELFKVNADFEERIDRNGDNQLLYARLIATLARRQNLRPLDRTAVARVIEHGARIVEDAEKLSIHMRDITDLVREAHYWAGQADHSVITAADVQQAIDAQIQRSDRLQERMREGVLRNTILVDTEGEAVGQINGLSVVSLGNYAFGHPSRITARVRLGKGEVLDIEREVELGGPIHSKGVLILSGFLGARYAAEQPLSLSASLVFEQSYGGVEGDSASSAELYALLSAIPQVPIKQSLAVTGSVNQRGQVQAIGGVNEKIEGFFDVCKARGLTGEQGVLIPASNVKHLMLRHDVVEAVTAGQFHVYPVETIDEGIEILTGLPAGERDEEGKYPEGSVNYLIETRLAEFAAKRSELAAAAKEGET